MITEVISQVSSAAKTILDKFVPDASQRMEAELLLTKQLHAINLAQIEVNKTEATSSSLFVSGWRPFIGWACGVSFIYALVGNDLFNWVLEIVATAKGVAIPRLPEPDTTLTFEILMGMLGFGGLRTYEKYKGVTR